MRMDLDLHRWSERFWAYGLYERSIVRWMRKLLRPGDHFIDAGANHGYFTLLGAQLVGRNGRVDSFEPVPETFARLKNNVALNDPIPQVHLHQVALSDHAGQVQFFANPINDGRSSLVPQEGETTVPVAVQAVRMDDVIPDARPALVKMDVEGAEPLAIDGMRGILKSAPAFIVEYSAVNAKPFGFEGRTMVDRLLDAQPRYKIYLLGRITRLISPTDQELATVSQRDNDSLLFTAQTL
jgi:FkbM family methyltransferase